MLVFLDGFLEVLYSFAFCEISLLYFYWLLFKDFISVSFLVQLLLKSFFFHFDCFQLVLKLICFAISFLIKNVIFGNFLIQLVLNLIFLYFDSFQLILELWKLRTFGISLFIHLSLKIFIFLLKFLYLLFVIWLAFQDALDLKVLSFDFIKHNLIFSFIFD